MLHVEKSNNESLKFKTALSDLALGLIRCWIKVGEDQPIFVALSCFNLHVELYHQNVEWESTYKRWFDAQVSKSIMILK